MLLLLLNTKVRFGRVLSRIFYRMLLWCPILLSIQHHDPLLLALDLPLLPLFPRETLCHITLDSFSLFCSLLVA